MFNTSPPHLAGEHTSLTMEVYRRWCYQWYVVCARARSESDQYSGARAPYCSSGTPCAPLHIGCSSNSNNSNNSNSNSSSISSGSSGSSNSHMTTMHRVDKWMGGKGETQTHNHTLARARTIGPVLQHTCTCTWTYVSITLLGNPCPPSLQVSARAICHCAARFAAGQSSRTMSWSFPHCQSSSKYTMNIEETSPIVRPLGVSSCGTASMQPVASCS